MAQSVSYSVVAPFTVQDCKYSTGHTAGISRELLISCVGPATSVSDGMVLDLSADITGTIYDVSFGLFTAGVPTTKVLMYSSASGSASTGVIKALSTSAGILVKGATDLSGVKWRMRVLHS